MKADVKVKWIAALRSGDYEQGKGALHKDGKFCCLGVLCDLAKKDLNMDWTTLEGAEAGLKLFDNHDDLPPLTVREWAGLSNGNPEVHDVGDDNHEWARPLSDWNDEQDYDFNQIAELINREL